MFPNISFSNFRRMSLYLAIKTIETYPNNTAIMFQMAESAKTIAIALGKDCTKIKTNAGPLTNYADKVSEIIDQLKQHLYSLGDFAHEFNKHNNEGGDLPPSIANYWPFDTADHLNLLLEYPGLPEKARILGRRKLIFHAIFEDIALAELGNSKLLKNSVFQINLPVPTVNNFNFFFRFGQATSTTDDGNTKRTSGKNFALKSVEFQLSPGKDRTNSRSISDKMAAKAEAIRTWLQVRADPIGKQLEGSPLMLELLTKEYQNFSDILQLPDASRMNDLTHLSHIEWDNWTATKPRPAHCDCNSDADPRKRTCTFLRGGLADRDFYLSLSSWVTKRVRTDTNVIFIRLLPDASLSSGALTSIILLHVIRALARQENLEWEHILPVIIKDAPTRHFAVIALKKLEDTQNKVRGIMNTLLMIWPKLFVEVFSNIKHGIPLEMCAVAPRSGQGEWDLAITTWDDFKTDLTPWNCGTKVDDRKHLKSTMEQIERMDKLLRPDGFIATYAQHLAATLKSYNDIRALAIRTSKVDEGRVLDQLVAWNIVPDPDGEEQNASKKSKADDTIEPCGEADEPPAPLDMETDAGPGDNLAASMQELPPSSDEEEQVKDQPLTTAEENKDASNASNKSNGTFGLFD